MFQNFSLENVTVLPFKRVWGKKGHSLKVKLKTYENKGIVPDMPYKVERQILCNEKKVWK